MPRTTRTLYIIVLSFAVLFVSAYTAAAQERIRSISAKGLYTTTSRLFPNPDAADEIARNRFNELNHIFGYGLDIRYGIPRLGFILGVSVERLQKTGDFFTRYERNDETYYVPTVDGYEIIPVELTAYFLIPVGSENFQFYIGGGAGVYLGRRFYEIANAQSESLERSLYPGIHVLSGIDYYFHRLLGLRLEMKFREPDIETNNRFDQSTTAYEGEEFDLPRGNVPSRVNVDGLVLTLGLVFRF